MTEKRETLIAPLGYQTTPNQYGVFPEGALSQAENVLTRYKGKLVYAPGIGPATSIGSASTQKTYALAPLDSGHVYAFVNNSSGNTWTVSESGNSASVPSALSATGLFPYTRTSPVRSRDRMLVNSNSGVLAADFMAPTSSGQRALRYAGLAQPLFGLTTFTTGANLAIPHGIMVSYAAVVTRESSDGYIIKSVPSPATKFYNNETSNGARPQFLYRTSADSAAGDFVEIYRTDGLSTTTVSADPGTTFKLIIRYRLTAADIASTAVTFFDDVPLIAPFYSTTGKELYTNPYQEGTTGANRQPEINGAQAVYKGFTFFGNITERPQVTFSVPGGIWTVGGTDSATHSVNRAFIGTRSGTCTAFSTGATSVTGVSTADMVGVRVGQEMQFGNWPPQTRVLTVSATSFTLDKAATSGGTTWQLSDMFECSLNNFPIPVNGAYYLVADLSLFFGTEVTVNQTTGQATSTLSSDVINDVGLVISVEPDRPYVSSFTVRATGGALYSPPLPEITATAQTFTQTTTPNLLRWSKDSEPEHAPSVNETRVGSGKIIQLVSTKDALWIFCTDGIFRLSGDAGVWQINVVAPGCVICSPGCATSMRDAVYAYTNYGFVAVTDAGVVPISDLQIKDQLPGPPYLEGATTNGFLVNNDDDEEVLIFTGFPAAKFYVYNARQNSFTYVQNAGTGMSNMTAAAFQQNPASGNAAVLLGDTSTVPKYAAWGRGNTSWLAPTVQYRALYAKNPMSVKQWIDFTLMFETFGQFSLSGTISGFFVGSATTLIGFNDTYATIGVPRKFAIATSLEPGFQAFSSPYQVAFEGISTRLVELGNQQVRR